MLKLIQFLELYENSWFDLLKSEPYCLNIQKSTEGQPPDTALWLFKYNQINSDMSNPIVRECRGIILRQSLDGWKVVCRPFDKFFNFGEPNARPMYFPSSVVFEKVDGSLLKMYHDGIKWRIATNGTIDANYSDTRVVGKTFYDLFLDVVGGEEGFKKMQEKVSTYFTYLFELIHPVARIVVNYGEKKELVLVGIRDVSPDNGLEIVITEECKQHFFDGLDFIRVPKIYKLESKSIDELQAVADSMNVEGFDFEGFVVAELDQFGWFVEGRVKIKSPKYLKFHHLAGGSIYNSLMELIMKNEIDEFNAYMTQLPFYVQEIYKDMKAKFDVFIEEGEKVVKEYREFASQNDRKTVALHMKDNVKGVFQPFVFQCLYSGKDTFKNALITKKQPKAVKNMIGVEEKQLEE